MTTQRRSPYALGYCDAYLHSRFDPPALGLGQYTSGHADGHCDAACDEPIGNPALAFAIDTTRADTALRTSVPAGDTQPGYGYRAPRARYGQRRHAAHFHLG